jgi:hypothetical protein
MFELLCVEKEREREGRRLLLLYDEISSDHQSNLSLSLEVETIVRAVRMHNAIQRGEARQRECVRSLSPGDQAMVWLQKGPAGKQPADFQAPAWN